MPQAKAIGRLAGYRYEAFGPAPADAAAQPATTEDRVFLANASLLIGERAGKHVDSGLAIFSDYPIVAARRTAYRVCAGYDCLANKGALAVQIKVPGVATPLTVIDTHLNSANASRAPRARSTYAYRRQIDALRSFIADVAPAGSPMLIAGDFNVGNHTDRRSYFQSQMLDAVAGLSAAEQRCGPSAQCQAGSPGGVAESIAHGKDWLLYRAGGAPALSPTQLEASFGRDSRGMMLSDHVGITATYALQPSAPEEHGIVVAGR